LKDIGIKENRLDVIKSGALIIQRVLNKLEIKNIISSKVGVKEGVYLSDMLRGSKVRFPANYNVSLRELIDSHSTEERYANQVTQLSKDIFKHTHNNFNVDKKFL